MAKLEIKPKRIEILDANDPQCRFRINIDVLNECFGLNKSMYMKASYPPSGPIGGKYISGTNANDKFFIWMPKLYGNSSEWNNRISADGTTIHESADPTKAEEYLPTSNEADAAACMKRLVFVKDSVTAPYRFVGVFEMSDYKYKRHEFKRVATRVRVIGDPVAHIEIIE